MPKVADNPRRIRMARLVRQEDDDRSFDQEFWDAIGAEGRFSAAWKMVTETMAMRGEDPDEPRLQRSLLRVQRR